MKKLKKLLAVLSSSVICALSITPIISNGFDYNVQYYTSEDGSLYVEENGKVYVCEKAPEITDFMYGYWGKLALISENGEFYTSKELNNDCNGNLYVCHSSSNKVGDIVYIQPAFYDFSMFKFQETETEEKKAFFEYVSANYPELAILSQEYDGNETINIAITNEAQLEEHTNFHLMYSESATVSEKYLIAKDIYENTNVFPYCPQFESESNSSALSAGDIDGNGEVTITDAAKIMSYAANPDKYPLSEISQIVGDVYNTGDGINNMDALQIQKMLAGLE